MRDALAALPDLKLLENEPLAKYTAARLGGPADLLVLARSTDALAGAANWAITNRIHWVILGGGANVLVSDEGFRGLVIINQTKAVTIDETTGRVSAESGVNLTTLARRCMLHGLKGFEWAVSVPGTVGGAVVNNAGAHGGDMAHNLREAEILDLAISSSPQIWPCERFEYAYRHSVLKGHPARFLVLSAGLQLETGHSPSELNAIADEFVAYRKRTQPPGASLGSIFKNPPGDYAGRLIELAGLKGHQIGGVQVSPVHANFFVHSGHGTAADYSGLITFVQETVLAKTGVALELEIERIGEGFSESDKSSI